MSYPYLSGRRITALAKKKKTSGYVVCPFFFNSIVRLDAIQQAHHVWKERIWKTVCNASARQFPDPANPDQRLMGQSQKGPVAGAKLFVQ